MLLDNAGLCVRISAHSGDGLLQPLVSCLLAWRAQRAYEEVRLLCEGLGDGRGGMCLGGFGCLEVPLEFAAVCPLSSQCPWSREATAGQPQLEDLGWAPRLAPAQLGPPAAVVGQVWDHTGGLVVKGGRRAGAVGQSAAAPHRCQGCRQLPGRGPPLSTPPSLLSELPGP